MFSLVNLPSYLHLKFQKIKYYSEGFFRYYLWPDEFCRRQLNGILESYYNDPDPEIEERVNYYNQIDESFQFEEKSPTIGEFSRHRSTAYSLDLHEIIRYFPEEYQFYHEFGDVSYIPDHPTFVKSRPISEDNQNSVLLKFNKKRHYRFVPDSIPFREKQDIAVWRGKAHTEERRNFVKKYYDHRKINAGDVQGRFLEEEFQAPFLSIDDQLEYKFIISLEGSDVASNLKWIMNSNSLCMMPKPTCESWFMEGMLEPGVHYVPLRDDFSDLEEKMDYYSHHVDEAQEIIDNANRHVNQFKNYERELLVGLLVVRKYFDVTGQL